MHQHSANTVPLPVARQTPANIPLSQFQALSAHCTHTVSALIPLHRVSRSGCAGDAGCACSRQSRRVVPRHCLLLVRAAGDWSCAQGAYCTCLASALLSMWLLSALRRLAVSAAASTGRILRFSDRNGQLFVCVCVNAEWSAVQLAPELNGSQEEDGMTLMLVFIVDVGACVHLVLHS